MVQKDDAIFKFRLKLQILVTLPVIIMGCVIISIAFKATQPFVNSSKAQVMKFSELVDKASKCLDSSGVEKSLAGRITRDLEQLQYDFRETVSLDTLRQIHSEKYLVLLFSGLIFVFSAFIMIYIHSLTGPIIRLQRIATLMGKGKDVGEIKVRGHDELQELAKGLEVLRQNLFSVKKTEDEIFKKIDSALYGLEETVSGRSAVKHEDLKALLSELREKITLLGKTRKGERL